MEAGGKQEDTRSGGEAGLEAAQMKMLRFSVGVTRMDRIKNEHKGAARITRLRDKVRKARLRWRGPLKRRDSDYIGREMLEISLPGRRGNCKIKRRFLDVLREDMQIAVVALDGVNGNGRSAVLT